MYPLRIFFPGAEPFHCHAELQDKHLLGNISAAKDRPKPNVHSVRTEGLHGWWAPPNKLLAWITLHDTDISVLGITPWDSVPCGRVQHILRHTPPWDNERVRDFLSQFSLHEFVLAELGVSPRLPELVIPCVMMAPFRDNIYVFLLNVLPEWRESPLHIVMSMLQCMYQVPLKCEQHGDTIQWCELSIPGGFDLRLLWKGIVRSLDDVDPSQSEWDRWLPASAPIAGKVMKG